MKKAKYHKVNRDECEVFLNTTSASSPSTATAGKNMEKAFDFSSINDYSSIYKFTNKNSLHRDRHLDFDSGTLILNIYSVLFIAEINFCFILSR